MAAKTRKRSSALRPSVFLSYRRDDSIGHAGRIYGELRRRLGPDRVFRDIEAIPLGADFVESVERTLAGCRVVIAIIGRRWLTVRQRGGRRIDEVRDPVRRELAFALQNQIPVIPVLVDEADMPHATQLPDELQPLSRANALTLHDDAFDYGMARLVEAIDQLAGPSGRAYSAIPEDPTYFERPHNLPVQLTSFIGRQRELEELKVILAANRLVTLTGAGGSGKTRLALQTAAEMLAEYPDGAHFVDLSPVTDQSLIAASVAAALALRERSGYSLEDTVSEYLSRRKLLVVLDNCEHLLQGCARLTARMLADAPELRVLATSQQPLNVPGEVRWRIPSLGLPPSEGGGGDAHFVVDSEAVQLFVERARLARPGFAMDDKSGPAVAQICRVLDGIPLAIELAAAQIAVLTPTDIVARLDDRFRLLGTGKRMATPRQQTLLAAVTWSHDLLDDAQKVLFRRLSVFSGGFDIDAAEAVGAGGSVETADVLGLLSGLVEKSLVVAGEGSDGRARYRLLETLRAFAHEQLLGTDETEPQRRRQAEYCLRLADDAEAKLRGAEAGALVARLNEEHDNLRAALSWAIEKDGALAMRLASSLTYFWRFRSHITEGRRWLARALDSTAPATAASARIGALICASDLAYDQGDYAAMPALLGEALELARRTGDKRSQASALMNLGIVSLDTEDYAAGTAVVAQSLALSEEIGDQRSVTRSRLYLAVLELSKGNLALARELYGPVVKAYRERADSRSLSVALQGVAMISVLEGDGVRARRELAEGLELSRRRGDKVWVARSIHGLACLAASESQAERAIRLRAAAEAIDAHLEVRSLPKFYRPFEESFEQMKEILGPETAAAVEEQGRRLSLDEACELALQGAG